MNAFIRCVNLIDSKLLSNCKFNQNMNIADKYRIATILANEIKRLGYKAELGYQTFLYFNEKESRRLFLFLFDRLSKQKQEEPKFVNRSLLNRLKSIEIDFNVKKKEDTDLKWRTANLDYLNYFMKNELESCVPFDNASLFIEWNALNLNTNSKLFARFYQSSKLILSKESIESATAGTRKNEFQNESKSLLRLQRDQINAQTDNSDEQITTLKDHLSQLEAQLELSKQQLKAREDVLKLKKERFSNLNLKFVDKNLELNKLRYSDKSNEELKDGIDEMKEKIDDVNRKWQLFNLEYDESISELKEKKRLIISKFNEINEEILSIKNQTEISKMKLKKIDDQSNELEQKNLDEVNDLDRKFYTKRIFEIINNVKKQENDIDNILIDIRNSQREINQLTGKVTRTYIVVEETVFKNSNLTDWSKRCYRLISELDTIYDKLINEIESCGQIKREILRFEEIVEGEKSNKIGSNLAKVTYDLEQLRKE